MNSARTKLKLLGLITLCLAGCAAGRAPPTQAANEVQITGILTKRGSQMESFWGVRDASRADGKLWRLEATDTSITEQLTQLQQQTVRVTGEISSDTTHSASLFPVLRVTKIELAAQSIAQ